ncbi:MAG: RND transporter [Betaproteobacteria bacterium]|nr:MAG: RND transporter [Betaproteobacteria bacterium]
MRLDAFRRALIAAALLAPLAAAAQSAPAAEPDMANGEVRRINKEQNKITLRHGEIKSLEMPPMTMVFTVRDPKLLDAVKVGDRVLFRAAKEDGGTYVVTAIKPAP